MLVLCLSHITCPLVALGGSGDLFICAKDLLVEAQSLDHASAMGPVASATSRIKNRRLIKGSGDLLPASPPAEKATARQDQAGKTGTRNHLILSRSQWRVIDAKTSDLPPGQPATALRASMVSARSCACCERATSCVQS